MDFEGGNAERPFVLGTHYNGEAKSGTNGTGKTGGIVNYELGTSYKLAPAGVKINSYICTLKINVLWNYLRDKAS